MLALGLVLYEGHSINKLQNGTIRLIFKIWNIQNIGFASDKKEELSDRKEELDGEQRKKNIIIY